MNKKIFKTVLLLSLIFANGVFAADPKTENDELIINSVTYIEDDADFDLGFNTADYLPEDFNPYEVYVDLESIVFIEEDVAINFNSKKHLPKGFDVYAYPTDVEGFNYIDENDEIVLGFDTKKYLPESFDPYMRYN